MSKGVVEFYTHGRATVQVNFPNGELKCKWCQFCHCEDKHFNTYRCLLTFRVLYDPEYAVLPAGCPLEIEGVK